MMETLFTCVGNFTKDLRDGKEFPGGSVYYSGCAAAALGARVRLVTSATPDFPFDEVRRLFDFELKLRESKGCTTMRNVYRRGRREQHVFNRGEKLLVSDVPREWLDGSIVLLCPVFGELPPELTRNVRGVVTGASLQGWLRTAGADNVVVPSRDVSFLNDLAGVDVLFFSDEDIGDHTKLRNVFRDAAPVVVETRGPNGARITVKGVTTWVPGYQVEEVDPTGAGDTFAAAFLLDYHLHRDPFKAAKFATRLSALEVTLLGPLTAAALKKAENVLETFA